MMWASSQMCILSVDSTFLAESKKFSASHLDLYMRYASLGSVSRVPTMMKLPALLSLTVLFLPFFIAFDPEEFPDVVRKPSAQMMCQHVVGRYWETCVERRMAV